MSDSYAGLDVKLDVKFTVVDAVVRAVDGAAAGLKGDSPLDWASLTGLVLGCIEAKFCK